MTYQNFFAPNRTIFKLTLFNWDIRWNLCLCLCLCRCAGVSFIFGRAGALSQDFYLIIHSGLLEITTSLPLKNCLAGNGMTFPQRFQITEIMKCKWRRHSKKYFKLIFQDSRKKFCERAQQKETAVRKLIDSQVPEVKVFSRGRGWRDRIPWANTIAVDTEDQIWTGPPYQVRPRDPLLRPLQVCYNTITIHLNISTN